MKRCIPQRLLFVGALAIATCVFGVTTVHAICPVNQQPCNGGCISEQDLCILEPLPGGVTSIPSGGSPLAPFFYYVNLGVWQWAFYMGVAIAILNGTAGGFQIVLSNGDSGKVDLGKKRFIGSAIGLIILLLSGVILEFLNPCGFTTPGSSVINPCL